MNIPYEQIKAKAQDRERALRALEAHLDHLEVVSERLLESLRYFKHMDTLACSLDREAQDLIPGFYGRMLKVGSMCNCFMTDLQRTEHAGTTGVLTALRQAVSEP